MVKSNLQIINIFEILVNFVNINRTTSDDINEWYTDCGNVKLEKNNIKGFFSLVCPETLELSAGCSIRACFDKAGQISDAGQ